MYATPLLSDELKVSAVTDINRPLGRAPTIVAQEPAPAGD